MHGIYAPVLLCLLAFFKTTTATRPALTRTMPDNDQDRQASMPEVAGNLFLPLDEYQSLLEYEYAGTEVAGEAEVPTAKEVANTTVPFRRNHLWGVRLNSPEKRNFLLGMVGGTAFSALAYVAFALYRSRTGRFPDNDIVYVYTEV